MKRANDGETLAIEHCDGLPRDYERQDPLVNLATVKDSVGERPLVNPRYPIPLVHGLNIVRALAHTGFSCLDRVVFFLALSYFPSVCNVHVAAGLAARAVLHSFPEAEWQQYLRNRICSAHFVCSLCFALRLDFAWGPVYRRHGLYFKQAGSFPIVTSSVPASCNIPISNGNVMIPPFRSRGESMLREMCFHYSILQHFVFERCDLRGAWNYAATCKSAMLLLMTIFNVSRGEGWGMLVKTFCQWRPSLGYTADVAMWTQAAYPQRQVTFHIIRSKWSSRHLPSKTRRSLATAEYVIPGFHFDFYNVDQRIDDDGAFVPNRRQSMYDFFVQHIMHLVVRKHANLNDAPVLPPFAEWHDLAPASGWRRPMVISTE